MIPKKGLTKGGGKGESLGMSVQDEQSTLSGGGHALLSIVILAAVATSAALVTRLIMSTERGVESANSTIETSLLEIPGAVGGVVNFGSQPRGVTRDFELTVRNPSESDSVRIEHVTSSCSCTVAPVEMLVLEPGAEAAILFTVALPANQSEWSVLLYFRFADVTPPQSVNVIFAMPAPFPEAMAGTVGGIQLPLHDDYEGVIDQVQCFAHLAEEPLDAKMNETGDVLLVESVPPGIDSLDLVVHVKSPNGAVERLVQYVRLGDAAPTE